MHKAFELPEADSNEAYLVLPMLITTKGAANFLNLSTSTLAKMRVRGDGPPFIKAGGKTVVYQHEDLIAWLRSRRRTSTSQPM